MIKNLKDLIEKHQGQRELALVFDLDCTLVDSSPLFPILEDNAAKLLWDRCQIPKDEALELISSYLATYGDCVRAPFRDLHGIDVETTLHHVFLPETLPTEILERWHCLSEFSERCDIPKYIFTNGPEPYMNHVLSHTGQRDHFIHHVATNHVSCDLKPATSAFDQFQDLTKLDPETHCIIFFEDNLNNIKAAEDRGWVCVWCTEFLDESFVKDQRDNVRSVIVDDLKHFLNLS